LLYAVTYAKILEPHGRLKGAARKLLIGTVQVVEVLIRAFAPSQ
jgi:hypothetical protein